METYSTAVLVVAVAVVLVVVRHDEELIVWICLCNSDVWIKLKGLQHQDVGAYLYTQKQVELYSLSPEGRTQLRHLFQKPPPPPREGGAIRRSCWSRPWTRFRSRFHGACTLWRKQTVLINKGSPLQSKLRTLTRQPRSLTNAPAFLESTFQESRAAGPEPSVQATK